MRIGKYLNNNISITQFIQYLPSYLCTASENYYYYRLQEDGYTH